MDFTEENDPKATPGNENGEYGQNTPENAGEKPKGKRLRIKDTRKIDYNRPSITTSRPYQPVYGQTRQSTPYQPRPYQPKEEDETRPRRQSPGGGEYDSDNRYYSGDSGYQPRRSYHQPGEYSGGGYPQRNYPQQGSGQSGYPQRRSYNNPGGGYPQRRNYDQGGGSNRPGGHYQRSHHPGSGGYNQAGGYNQTGGGYNQGRYNPAGYNQGGYNPGGYNPAGGYPQRRPGGGGPNMRKPAPGGRNTYSKHSLPKPVKYQEVITDPAAPIRLNKYLANAGVCSRREADDFIQAGVVKVNSEIVTALGTKITRLDKVSFQDQSVQLESKVYILLNKPKNCVTTSDDPQNRQTVMDLVKNACQERIYPVGRLDRNTTGVLLLTNDGEMAAKLTHPSYKKKKIYHVWLDHEVAVEDMEKLANGIELGDGEIHADAISYANENDRSQVGIEIHSGKNRIVRRMFETMGYHVLKLDRVYFAGLTKRHLGRGKWRYLSEQEVNALRIGAYE
ncbi:MAG: pseudouridine synthase [Dysgonamonadaceae bacterium]|jgi:23S rRNA pseudouridine2605 synthase|nr:pseudouridine synthase [Dysgonamonadaceae bacterium]